MMLREDVSQDKKVDWDIEKMLDDIGADWMKATEAYHRGHENGYGDGWGDGYYEGLTQVRAIEMASVKNQMVGPAEMFYTLLQKIVPKEDILQHRIGMDYDAMTPTTLSVIPHKYADKIQDILDMAARLEVYLFQRGDCNCSFWVITDEHIEQSLVDHDFPYYRKDV